MANENYLRRYRLKVGRQSGTRTFEMVPFADGLRITFQVTHFAGNALSVADITIYNVSAVTTAQMLGDGAAKPYEFISLEAGYETIFGNIFLGQITNVQRVLEDGGATRGIRFFCMSSAKAYDQNIINLTLSAETDPVQIIEACAEKFDAEIRFFGDFSDLPRRSRGTVFQGSPTAFMNELAETFQFDWMVENDVIKIIKRGFAMPVKAVINSATGMIGSPSVSYSEIGIRCTLNPTLKLGDTIKLESVAPRFEYAGAFYSRIERTLGEGYYKIFSLVFAGDSHGDQWEAQISCLHLDTAAQAGLSTGATR